MTQARMVALELGCGAGIDLHEGQILACRAANPLLLFCSRGALWLTADGRDVVLVAGQTHEVPAGRRVVLEAMRGPARLTLQGVSAGAPARSSVQDGCARAGRPAVGWPAIG